MLPKEDREIISQIGRYKYKKMKEAGFDNFEDFAKFRQEVKIQNKNKYAEKNKIRFRTIRYIQRYCSLEMKCQICGTKETIQIHHPNYNDYLKVNLLCQKHHTALHNFELVPPSIIDLEKIRKRTPPQEERKEYIQSQIGAIKSDVLTGRYNYSSLYKKYGISASTIKIYLKKEKDWSVLQEKLKKASVVIDRKLKHKDNPIQKYRLENRMTIKQFSDVTQIPVPTLRAIESGKTNFANIKFTTKEKLRKLGIEQKIK